MGLLLEKLLARISAPRSLWLPYAYAAAAGATDAIGDAFARFPSHNNT
jgi:hypothetical protein